MREAPFTSLSRGGEGRSTRLARAALMLVSGLVLLVISPMAFGEAPPPDYRVIVHPGRPDTRVSREFVANALLKNITRWSNDEAIRPADQRVDSAVRRTFSERVLKRSVQAVKTYWQQRIFSGRGVPPPELESDEAIVRYVENNPGALGYISGTAAAGKTKVLAVTH
jgi:ABC-type phosphate transport system substrate-binding protein